MSLRDRLFFRTLLRSFRLMTTEVAGEPLVAYFQYKIGPFQPDYYLYFPREPDGRRYVYEIFDKLFALEGYDIPLYLDFHYSRYSGKASFRRFLRYEMAPMLSAPAKRMRKHQVKLRVVEQWLEEQEKLDTANVSVDDAGRGFDQVSELIEEKMTASYGSHHGEIVINGSHQIGKVIELLILLKDLRAGKTGEELFTSFSTSDMAAILRQFEGLRPLKVNTLQKKIAEYTAVLRKDDKARPLENALVEYFFGPPPPMGNP